MIWLYLRLEIFILWIEKKEYKIYHIHLHQFSKMLNAWIVEIIAIKTKIQFAVEALVCSSVACYRKNALSKKCFWLNTFNQSDLLLPFGGVNLCKSGWISFQCYKKNLLSVWNLSAYLLYSTYNNFFSWSHHENLCLKCTKEMYEILMYNLATECLV